METFSLFLGFVFFVFLFFYPFPCFYCLYLRNWNLDENEAWRDLSKEFFTWNTYRNFIFECYSPRYEFFIARGGGIPIIFLILKQNGLSVNRVFLASKQNISIFALDHISPSHNMAKQSSCWPNNLYFFLKRYYFWKSWTSLLACQE